MFVLRYKNMIFFFSMFPVVFFYRNDQCIASLQIGFKPQFHEAVIDVFFVKVYTDRFFRYMKLPIVFRV